MELINFINLTKQKEKPLSNDDIINKLGLIQSQLKKLENSENLLHDVEGVIKSLKQPKDVSAKYQIAFTDNYWDLFLCGTDVEGSCQRVDGTSNLNKCLLGYVMDGKIRLVAIKDSTGKIVARSIIRLLIDKKTGSPVLFFERIYPQVLDTKFAEALKQKALELSRELGLPIYQTGTDAAEIVSLSSRAPWEYVDASEGVHKNGIYTISRVSPL